MGVADQDGHGTERGCEQSLSRRARLVVSRPLEGRRALVTGGGAGIGRAIVRALAREGARVAVSDLDRAAADDAASEVSGVPFALDVRDAAATAAVVAEAAAALGGLDAAVANAGVSTMARVVDLTESEWDFNMDVNAKGVFLTNQAVVRHFLATGTRGAIVNTASLAAKVGAPLLAHYSASKFAVAGFTQALAREVAPQGIRVNCVCPGFVRTSMQAREVVWEAKLRGLPDDAVRAEYVAQTPLGRLQEPEDVADVVAFLLGDGARFMTGLALDVNGGVFMS
jgi:NAD(P)-dependent dehydrogenase (short-subunit alcohol dehydrogenase family)